MVSRDFLLCMLNQRLLHLEETLGTSATPVSTQLSDLTANVAAAVGASPAAAQLLSLMQAHRSTLSSPAALLPEKPDMLLAASDDLELFAEQVFTVFLLFDSFLDSFLCPF